MAQAKQSAWCRSSSTSTFARAISKLILREPMASWECVRGRSGPYDGRNPEADAWRAARAALIILADRTGRGRREAQTPTSDSEIRTQPGPEAGTRAAGGRCSGSTGEARRAGAGTGHQAALDLHEIGAARLV